jgi:hypothetical protein
MAQFFLAARSLTGAAFILASALTVSPINAASAASQAVIDRCAVKLQARPNEVEEVCRLGCARQRRACLKAVNDWWAAHRTPTGGREAYCSNDYDFCINSCDENPCGGPNKQQSEFRRKYKYIFPEWNPR